MFKSLILLAAAAHGMMLFVSTEYEYIWTLSFNGTDFEIVNKTKSGARPTWITLNSDKTELFATDEVDTPVGAINGFKVYSDYSLEQFMEVDMTTWGSCHAITNDNEVFVANYGGVFNTANIATANLTQALDFRNDTGTGPNPGRQQDGSHPHMVGLYKNFAYGVDLGLDQIDQWKVENGELVQVADPIKTAAGAGPRHIAFHPTLPIAFVVNELFNNVQAYVIEKDGSLTATGPVTSTLPSGVNSADNSAAEIHTSNDGNFLYVSNRGKSNTIVSFEIDFNGIDLSNPVFVESGGVYPRQFELDDTNEWLVVANQLSHLVTMFSRAADGSLTAVADIEIQGPTCAIFA